MGGLACGCPLCADCEHGPRGEHITKEAADEIRRRDSEEREARTASRTSSTQRMDVELDVPATLFELLKGDWKAAGYELKKVYFLELKHGLMGCFPAIFSSDEKRMVFTSGLHLLERVWRTLEPREATLREITGYVNDGLGILYIDTGLPEQREDEEPKKLLTVEEFDDLVKTEESPFKWAFGLIGGRTFNQDAFLQHLGRQAKRLDPTFGGVTV